MSTLEYHFYPFERVQVRKNERNSKNDDLGTCTRMTYWRALVPFTGLVGLAIKQCLPIYNKYILQAIPKTSYKFQLFHKKCKYLEKGKK